MKNKSVDLGLFQKLFIYAPLASSVSLLQASFASPIYSHVSIFSKETKVVGHILDNSKVSKYLLILLSKDHSALPRQTNYK